jgi:Ras-related protein Rab-21
VILVVFDVTDPDSFEQLKHWIEEVKNNSQKNSRIIIIGNKIDLLDDRADKDKIEEVSYKEAEAYAKSIGA